MTETTRAKPPTVKRALMGDLLQTVGILPILVLIVVVLNRVVAAAMAERQQAAIASGQAPRDVHSPYWEGA